MEDDELNLDDLKLDDINLNKDNLDLSDLAQEDEDETIESNEVLDNPEKLTLGLSGEQIEAYYDYLAGKVPRPIFAEKFFADGTSRLNEAGLLVNLMSTSFVPKLLAMQESLVNSLANVENIKYLSSSEKMNLLNTLSAMSTKITDTAMKFNQSSRDFNGVPLIYRQLLDQLLMLDSDKLPRLKMIPELVEVSEDRWNRIVEIANIKG